MFACFVSALLGFPAREFPAKSEKTLDIYHILKVACVLFGRVKSWGCGGLGVRLNSLFPLVNLILDDFLGS